MLEGESTLLLLFFGVGGAIFSSDVTGDDTILSEGLCEPDFSMLLECFIRRGGGIGGGGGIGAVLD
jgi:hypothetical protein